MKRIAIRGKDLSGLKIAKFLKLWLGALDLPIACSKRQLQNRLKQALLGSSAKPHSNTANSKQQKQTSSQSHVNARPGWSTRKNNGDLPLFFRNLPYQSKQCGDREPRTRARRQRPVRPCLAVFH